MNILHIAAHLGGGVGKAHASLCKATPKTIERHYVLLERPRDRRYVEEIRATGAAITEAPTPAALALLASQADIVQIEWWNHPALYQIVCTTPFPPMRTVFWCHISGLHPPLIPTGLLSIGHRFVFTSECSFQSPDVLTLPSSERSRLHAISSGFGFENVSGAPACLRNPSTIGYLGTLDFVKMSPDFFDVVDAVEDDITVSLWGGFDPLGDVASKIAAMRHPERIIVRGHVADPRTALQSCGIFLYLLQPKHYGTAENALVEAMSLGCVPLTFANPAEAVTIDHGVTGYLAEDKTEAIELLTTMLREPGNLGPIGAQAMAFAAQQRTAARSASLFNTLYRDVYTEDKRTMRFDEVLGRTGAQWFLSTQRRAPPFGDDSDRLIQTFDSSGAEAKGSLAHFRACLPNDPSLKGL